MNKVAITVYVDENQKKLLEKNKKSFNIHDEVDKLIFERLESEKALLEKIKYLENEINYIRTSIEVRNDMKLNEEMVNTIKESAIAIKDKPTIKQGRYNLFCNRHGDVMTFTEFIDLTKKYLEQAENEESERKNSLKLKR